MTFQTYKILEKKLQAGDLSHSPTRECDQDMLLSTKKSEYKIRI